MAWCLWWWNGMMVVLYQERCVWRYIQFTFFFIWHLHYISFIALAYGVMSRTYGSDRTGTASFIRHNDATSYLVGYEGRRHGIALVLCFWDVRCMPWSMTLGDIGKKWYLTKDWWWLISSFMRLYYLIRYTLLFLFGSPAMEILKWCLMNL